jgi:drug/metabolite transporter (DMT)-like permease
MSLLAHPSNRLATGVLLFSAALWGLSWMPLKWFIDQGLTGPMVSLLSYGMVGLFSCVFIWRQRAAWRAQWGLLLALAVVGGWANTSFVNAIMLGDVVRVMFLFYLSPVWSVLGGWLFLKERIPPLRWAAVFVALLGLWLFLGGPGGIDLSFNFIDFLALSAGFCFAANNVIARAAQQVPMVSKTFAVFVGCGVISLMATTALGHRLPEQGRCDLAGRAGGGCADSTVVRQRIHDRHGVGRWRVDRHRRAGRSPRHLDRSQTPSTRNLNEHRVDEPALVGGLPVAHPE